MIDKYDFKCEDVACVVHAMKTFNDSEASKEPFIWSDLWDGLAEFIGDIADEALFDTHREEICGDVYGNCGNPWEI